MTLSNVSTPPLVARPLPGVRNTAMLANAAPVAPRPVTSVPPAPGFGAKLVGAFNRLITGAANAPAAVTPTPDTPDGDGPALTALIAQANAAIRTTYPNAKVYEVAGTRDDSDLVEAGSFSNWSFGAVDDADNPTKTVYIDYADGQFSTPTTKPRFDLDRELTDAMPTIGLHDAIADLRAAGFSQDFRYVDLFSVFNPAYGGLLYVFSGPEAIVTVGANSGVVTQQHSKDWCSGSFDGDTAAGCSVTYGER